MNNDNTLVNQELLNRARQLVEHLESGNVDAATGVLDELTLLRESELFKEVGKLTRQVHDALVNFEFDETVQSLASCDISDAKERLNYVITMTSQSANRTLNAVEEAFPPCERMAEEACRLNEEWQRFMRREMNVDDFRLISRDIGAFLADTEQSVSRLKDNLNEVLMAQEFQDLTGQIINRVIRLVEDVESGLVRLIRITGSAKAQSTSESQEDYLAGPQVPTIMSSSAVNSQDEVDDLLSSLGF